MKLQDIIKPLLKWWWLIVIATMIAGISGYLVTKDQPPVYQARATLIVGSSFFSLNPTGSDFGLSQALAETYADLANREPVQEAVKASLGIPFLPKYQASAIGNTELIEILVTDTNPQRAAAVANELGNQLIRQSPTETQQQDQQRRAFINQQLDDMQQQMDKLSKDIQAKQEALQGMTGAAQINDAQAEINAMETKFSLLQTNYVTLYANSQKGAVNQLSFVEKADAPRIPVGPNKNAIILLVAAAGLLLSSGAAHLLEYLDRSIKTPEDVTRALGLPVIGYIGEMSKAKDQFAYVSEHPRSPIAEAFRSLRTNIEFAAATHPIKTILITSPSTKDGKTTMASNLAIIMSQGERKVVLMDADLRRPSIHDSLNIPIQPGLSDVFRDRISVFDAVRAWKDKRVTVITAGNPPPNPTELLASRKMDQILASLGDLVDTIILDGPPMVVTDSTVVASKADAVLLVLRPGQTREEIARAMVEQLRRVNANVVGVIFNRISRRGAEVYGGYEAYSPYYGDSSYFESGNGSGKSKTLVKEKKRFLGL